MGCDIHVHVERLDSDGSWAYQEPPEIELYYYPKSMAKPCMGRYWYWGRNYTLFSLLAGVRNGIESFYGPATGHYLTPMSLPRGIPDDVSPELRQEYDDWDLDGHSHSWFTLRELMLFDYDTTQARFAGMVSAREYQRWKDEGSPQSWSGGVGGGGIKIVTNEELDRLIASGEVDPNTETQFGMSAGKQYYTKVEWVAALRDCLGKNWFEFLDRMRALTRDDGSDVRTVFWFDS